MRWMLVMLVVGCTSADVDMETPDAMPPTNAEVVDAYATASCKRLIRCEWKDWVPGAGGYGVPQDQCEIDLRVYECDVLDCSGLYAGNWPALRSCLDTFEHAPCDVSPTLCRLER